MFTRVTPDFFQGDDVTAVARQLLGYRLWTATGTATTAGVIVETEAYDGLTDRASHAFGGKKTPRTRIFYSQGGIAYTYLCYGIHTLFNIITGPAGIPHAVLIRAVAPCEGIETILARRGHDRLKRNTAGGPGLVSQALGITREHNGIPVTGENIWLTHPVDGEKPGQDEILATPRVGIGYAGEDARLPWRFRVASSPWTSPAK
ncbi:DNA-3-methyladenine glycosylase [Balneolales bacterium ANBcel1]|nr:DNA-3-methyladenine glycosylase [Balneolales bacterium ANBcel1]